MKIAHRLFALPLTLLLALSFAGCSSDDSGTNPPSGNGDNITIPASWGGTWQITTTPVAPITRGESIEIGIEPLCAGMSVADLFGDLGDMGMGTVTCTGTWTDAAADIQCTSTFSYEGCTFTATTTLNMTRSGEQMNGTQSVTTTTSGTKCGNSTQTSNYQIAGDRLNNDQFGCNTSLSYTAPASWGGLWSISETPIGGRAGGGIPVQVCPDLSTATDVFYPTNFDASTTGGFQDGAAEVYGSWSVPMGSCLWLYSEKISVMRKGGSLSGTRVQTIQKVTDPNQGGQCSEMPESTTFQITGTRMSEDTSGCGFGAVAPPRDEFDHRTYRLF